jgi:hypothetical protein
MNDQVDNLTAPCTAGAPALQLTPPALRAVPTRACRRKQASPQSPQGLGSAACLPDGAGLQLARVRTVPDGDSAHPVQFAGAVLQGAHPLHSAAEYIASA